MRARTLLAVAIAPLTSACVHGLIYTHTIEPLDTNFDRTPVFRAKTEAGQGDVKEVSVHYFPVYIDIAWDSNAIGDIARREGLDEVYYADVETLSVMGVWNQETVHVYGKPAAGVH